MKAHYAFLTGEAPAPEEEEIGGKRGRRGSSSLPAGGTGADDGDYVDSGNVSGGGGGGYATGQKRGPTIKPWLLKKFDQLTKKTDQKCVSLTVSSQPLRWLTHLLIPVVAHTLMCSRSCRTSEPGPSTISTSVNPSLSTTFSPRSIKGNTEASTNSRRTSRLRSTTPCSSTRSSRRSGMMPKLCS